MPNDRGHPLSDSPSFTQLEHSAGAVEVGAVSPPNEPSLAPEFRRDPVTGRWVVVAPERSLRPLTLQDAQPHGRVTNGRATCPFCPGREYETPNEVLAYRAPDSPRDGPGWWLRVVPNKFPAVKPEASDEPRKTGGLFDRFPGVGRHEVVIETPDHLVNPALIPDAQLRDVFLAYRDRLNAMAADPNLHYASVFKNVGAESGASVGHCHSQIVATPLIPDLIGRELRGADGYYSQHHRCVFCEVLRQELADRTRVVAETERFVAVTAFAGRFAYETWVLPKRHESRYESITNAAADEFAGLMKRVLRAIDAVLGGPAYNWFLHTSPLRSADLPYYHWHFEIIPRTSRPAGFEWGAGCFINAVAPEQAAADLRSGSARKTRSDNGRPG